MNPLIYSLLVYSGHGMVDRPDQSLWVLCMEGSGEHDMHAGDRVYLLFFIFKLFTVDFDHNVQSSCSLS